MRLNAPLAVVGFIVSLSLFVASSIAASAQEYRMPPSITVSGHGEVFAVPDTAMVNSGVVSRAPTAREALDLNNKDMAALVAALKEAGIESKDIQTSGFNVNPEFVYGTEPDVNGYQKPPKLVGYTVSNMVTVKVRDIANLGAVLDRAVTVGANSINGVSFSVEDAKALYEEARKAAFEDARAKADTYAGVGGFDLNVVYSVSEGQGYAPPPMPYVQAMDMSAKNFASPAVPVQAGQMGFTVDVSVTWLITQSLGQ